MASNPCLQGADYWRSIQARMQVHGLRARVGVSVAQMLAQEPRPMICVCSWELMLAGLCDVLSPSAVSVLLCTMEF